MQSIHHIDQHKLCQWKCSTGVCEILFQREIVKTWAQHFTEIHCHCPVPSQYTLGCLISSHQSQLGAEWKHQAFKCWFCVVPLMWKCFPLLSEQQLLFAAATSFFLRVFGEFSKRSCFVPSSQLNFIFPASSLPKESLMAVGNQERLQCFLLQGWRVLISANRGSAEGSDPNTATRRTSRDQARGKHMAIGTNFTFRVNLTVGNILKCGKKQKEIREIWSGFSWAACCEQNSAFSFLRDAHSSAGKAVRSSRGEPFFF